MSEQRPEDASDESAWVTIPTSLGRDELLLFCQDIERLLRINPLWIFKDWQRVDDDQYRFKILNESNGLELETMLRVERLKDGCHLHYADGIKQRTTFRVVEGESGAALLLLDDYSGIKEGEREARADEADKSLIPWGNAIQSYLVQWRRWAWFPIYRFYMRWVWQPMKPSARRIVFMITVVTALEFFAFLMVFFIFWLELDHLFEL